MDKIQKFLRLIRSDLAFIILILIVILGLFITLSPKVSSQIFPFKRQAILDEFINATKNNGFVDPQEYWKFREFYSPGYFTFSRNGIEESLAREMKDKIGIIYDEKNVDLAFLVFSSPLVSSLDMLTTQSDLSKIVDQFPRENIIFINKNSLIYEETPKIIKIVFLLSNNDMKKANGFFDYNDKDKKLVENKNWLNITAVKK